MKYNYNYMFYSYKYNCKNTIDFKSGCTRGLLPALSTVIHFFRFGN